MKQDPFTNPRFGLGNIDLLKRPAVKLPDGRVASVLSKSYNLDGEEVLLPTVRHGLDRPMTDPETVDWYKKTGEYLGKFSSPEEASQYAVKLHEAQAKLMDLLGKK